MILLKSEVLAISVDDFHDLVMAVIQLRVVSDGYSDLGIDEPQWLVEKIRDAESELKHRRRDAKERKLIELRMKREGLKSRDEKRGDTEEEIRKLEEELA